ncbi:MAG: vitamin K epoxide reductase family protein [bacterium]|nr:vitamin K epoxide reductase family protein [bacterium]
MPWDQRSKRLVIALLIIAILGFLDATYLTVQHYLGQAPACGALRGCETVTSSTYSVLFSVPIALFGALYYLAMIAGSIFTLDTKNVVLLRWLARLTAAGFLFSLWLVYIQLFVIEAVCIYCMASAGTSTLLFITGIMILLRKRQNTLNQAV